MPVSSGVRLRGRVVKQPFAAGSIPHGGGPILKSTGGSDAPRPARNPFADGSLPPPWHSPHACEITRYRPRSTRASPVAAAAAAGAAGFCVAACTASSSVTGATVVLTARTATAVTNMSVTTNSALLKEIPILRIPASSLAPAERRQQLQNSHHPHVFVV